MLTQVDNEPGFSKMSKLQANYSENEDDPEMFESSGDEWNASEEKKRNKRRSSQRLCKKPKVEHIDISSDESDECNIKSRNKVNKRKKVVPSIKKREPHTGMELQSPFKTGSFLVLKKDAQAGDPLKQPCIWKIDGKALLQKFEPFDENGMIKHRNTSIYTGWSVLDKDLYAPILVRVELHAAQKMIVQMNYDQLKDINMESD